VEISA
jgi:hypothetical protein